MVRSAFYEFMKYSVLSVRLILYFELEIFIRNFKKDPDEKYFRLW